MLCYALQDCLCRPQSRVISRLRKLLSGSKKELFKRWYLKAQEERAWGSHMDLLTGDAKMKSKKRAEMARKRAELIAAAGGDEEAALAALEAEMATIASSPLTTTSRSPPSSRRRPSPRRHSARSPSAPRSPGRDPFELSARASPMTPRTSQGRSITHMWDMVRYVTGVYSDVHKQNF